MGVGPNPEKNWRRAESGKGRRHSRSGECTVVSSQTASARHTPLLLRSLLAVPRVVRACEWAPLATAQRRGSENAVRVRKQQHTQASRHTCKWKTNRTLHAVSCSPSWETCQKKRRTDGQGKEKQSRGVRLAGAAAWEAAEGHMGARNGRSC